VLFLLGLFHFAYLPSPEQTKPQYKGRNALKTELWDIVSSFFNRPQMWAVVLYILIFRFGEALALKMAPSFLLDPLDKGGLHFSIADVGLINGTVGVSALIVGGILGGFAIAKFGLKQLLLPFALIQNITILLYWLLSITKPTFVVVALFNGLEQLGYGLGVAAYTVFLLSTVRAQYKASHYAIATGLMAIGIWLPGTVSGFLQTALGYSNFFLLSFILSLPGIITIFFLPLAKSSEFSK
jgi:PAT family beta-lactamase induction signal transducer AmpG